MASYGLLHRAARLAAAGVLLLLTGCAAVFTQGPVSNAPLPPAASGTGRIIFYRAANYEASQESTTVYLNGTATGIAQPAAMFYRDLPPGTYNVTAAPTLPYQNQFPTVTVKAGDVIYLQIGILTNMTDMAPERSTHDTFVLSIVDPRVGAYQTYALRRT